MPNIPAISHRMTIYGTEDFNVTSCLVGGNVIHTAALHYIRVDRHNNTFFLPLQSINCKHFVESFPVAFSTKHTIYLAIQISDCTRSQRDTTLDEGKTDIRVFTSDAHS